MLVGVRVAVAVEVRVAVMVRVVVVVGVASRFTTPGVTKGNCSTVATATARGKTIIFEYSLNFAGTELRKFISLAQSPLEHTATKEICQVMSNESLFESLPHGSPKKKPNTSGLRQTWHRFRKTDGDSLGGCRQSKVCSDDEADVNLAVRASKRLDVVLRNIEHPG